jgi:ribonuclease P protein component
LFFSTIIRGASNETDLSAVGRTAQKNARFSGAHEDARRQGGDSRAPRQGTPQLKRVNPRALPRLTFRRSQRLAGSAEFALALRARPVHNSPHFQVFRPLSEAGPRLGIIVGKRFIARSVDRSRVKRLIRECFRTRRPGLPQADYVVRVRNPVKMIDVAMLRSELEGLLGLAPSVQPALPAKD